MTRFLVLVLGFACACPLILIGGIHVRLSDVAALVAAAGSLAIVSRTGLTGRLGGFCLLIAALTVGWVWAELTYTSILPGYLPVTMILVRWVVAIPAAFFLCFLSQDRLLRNALLSGIILGLLTDTAFLVYDFGIYQLTGEPGLPWNSPSWFVEDRFRASGLDGTPNGAAIGADFLVPFLLGAAGEYRWRRWPWIFSALVAVAVFLSTESRGAFSTSALLLLVWLTMSYPRRSIFIGASVAVFAALAYELAPLAFHSAMHGSDLTDFARRFAASRAMESNAAARDDTIWNSAKLALQYPLGMGSTYVDVMFARTGYKATHNGILQLALMGGLPLAFVVSGVLATGAFAVVYPRRRTENWVAAYIIGVSLFESVFFIPYFPVLLLWVGGMVVSTAEDPAPYQGVTRRRLSHFGSS